MRLMLTTAALLNERGLPTIASVSSRTEELERIADTVSQLTIVAVPKRRAVMLVTRKSAQSAASGTLDDFSEAGVERLVILMPHPWDMTLTNSARAAGFEVLQIIHDARRHPGDVWPTTREVRQRVEAAHITLCLSRSVARELRPYAHELRVAPHPAILMDHQGRRHRIQNASGRQVVFVGRLRTYKGIDLLLRAWPLVSTPNANLLIAGHGRLGMSKLPPAVTVRNEWLSDTQIESIIKSADVIVCPYTEASQSGIIPLAHASGIPVVVTPVGGLIEQIVADRDGVVAADCTPQHVAAAIDRALNRIWNIRPHSASNEDFINALLLPGK